MPKFSERIGLEPTPKVLQTQGLSDRLRTRLWNGVYSWLFNKMTRYGDFTYRYCSPIWDELGLDLAAMPSAPRAVLETLRTHIFTLPWNNFYELLEFVVALEPTEKDRLCQQFNRIIENELGAYRFVDHILIPITDEIEIDSLKESLDRTHFPGAATHIKTALRYLSSHENPDYRNSIKESISAVESACMQITGETNQALGKLLNKLERDKLIHHALAKSFSKLYGYASNEDGIRHAMIDEPNLTVNDAKLMLIICSSFVNYLKTIAQ